VSEEPKKNNLIPILMWVSVAFSIVAFGVLTIFNTLFLGMIIAYLIGISGG